VTRDSFPWPCLTTDLPGVGGHIKRHDEDFVVTELPLYPPSGEGTHTYFVIEKRGLTTMAAVRIIARGLNKRPSDIGYAGLKDAHGVTRQTLSVEHVSGDHIRETQFARIKVISVNRHTNKLKVGHLSGNRFVIKIRGADRDPLPRVRSILDVLTARGLPNYFGPQRFGVRGDNARVGKAVLSGDYDQAVALILGRPSTADRPEAHKARGLFDAGRYDQAMATWPTELSDQTRLLRTFINTGYDTRRTWRAVEHRMRKLYLSAFQSELFNTVLAERIHGIDRLQTGDVAWKHRNGACFLVEDAAVEQPRCDAFEISPSGPLFGKKMKSASGQPGRIEEEVLAGSEMRRENEDASGMRPTQEGGIRLDGARRPLRIPLDDAEVDEGTDDSGTFVRLEFSLPPGAYATCLTRETCKTSAAANDNRFEKTT